MDFSSSNLSNPLSKASGWLTSIVLQGKDQEQNPNEDLMGIPLLKSSWKEEGNHQLMWNTDLFKWCKTLHHIPLVFITLWAILVLRYEEDKLPLKPIHKTELGQNIVARLLSEWASFLHHATLLSNHCDCLSVCFWMQIKGLVISFQVLNGILGWEYLKIISVSCRWYEVSHLLSWWDPSIHYASFCGMPSWDTSGAFSAAGLGNSLPQEIHLIPFAFYSPPSFLVYLAKVLDCLLFLSRFSPAQLVFCTSFVCGEIKIFFILLLAALGTLLSWKAG